MKGMGNKKNPYTPFMGGVDEYLFPIAESILNNTSITIFYEPHIQVSIVSYRTASQDTK
jgi:hypothetical protein